MDGLVRKLDAAQPIAGAQLIVMSEHVTYWDQDGWKDPNSSQALTDRQDSYEKKLGVAQVYTPQFIVDGTHNVKVTDAKQVESTLREAGAEQKIPVRIGEVAFNSGAVHAHVETDSNGEHNADVYVALALDHVESQVLKGENGGKHLVHVAVVQELEKVGKLPKGKNFSHDVQLKLKSGIDPKNVRLIAFVQESGPGKILGAALLKPASESAENAAQPRR